MQTLERKLRLVLILRHDVVYTGSGRLVNVFLALYSEISLSLFFFVLSTSVRNCRSIALSCGVIGRIATFTVLHSCTLCANRLFGA